jgi:hypothetical protein
MSMRIGTSPVFTFDKDYPANADGSAKTILRTFQLRLRLCTRWCRGRAALRSNRTASRTPSSLTDDQSFKAILCVVLVLFAPGGCFAAIAAGACATGTTGNGSGVATPACNLSAGQLVYLGCSSFNGTFTGTPVTDSVGGNSWVQDGTTGSTTATGKIALFHTVLTNGGATITAQCNYTAAVDSGVAWQNFTGNAAAGNTDGTASNGSGSSNAPNSGHDYSHANGRCNLRGNDTRQCACHDKRYEFFRGL